MKKLTLQDFPEPKEVHDYIVNTNDWEVSYKTRFRSATLAINFILNHLNNKINKSEHNRYCYCKTDYKCLYCTHHKCCD